MLEREVENLLEQKLKKLNWIIDVGMPNRQVYRQQPRTEDEIESLKINGIQKFPDFILYEDENTKKVIGFIHAQVYESVYSDTGLNILGLAVDPDFHGNGFGKKLIDYIEKYAMDNGISFIRLNSANHRVEAHKFYENIGYKCDKLQKRCIKYFNI